MAQGKRHASADTEQRQVKTITASMIEEVHCAAGSSSHAATTEVAQSMLDLQTRSSHLNLQDFGSWPPRTLKISQNQ